MPASKLNALGSGIESEIAISAKPGLFVALKTSLPSELEVTTTEIAVDATVGTVLFALVAFAELCSVVYATEVSEIPLDESNDETLVVLLPESEP